MLSDPWQIRAFNNRSIYIVLEITAWVNSSRCSIQALILIVIITILECLLFYKLKCSNLGSLGTNVLTWLDWVSSCLFFGVEECDLKLVNNGPRIIGVLVWCSIGFQAVPTVEEFAHIPANMGRDQVLATRMIVFEIVQINNSIIKNDEFSAISNQFVELSQRHRSARVVLEHVLEIASQEHLMPDFEKEKDAEEKTNLHFVKICLNIAIVAIWMNTSSTSKLSKS